MKKIEKLLTYFFNIIFNSNIEEKKIKKLLINFIKINNITLFKILIKKKEIELYSVFNKGQELLNLAAKYKRHDILNIIINKYYLDLDFTFQNSVGLNQIDLVKILILNKNININSYYDSAIIKSAKNNNKEIVQLLLNDKRIHKSNSIPKAIKNNLKHENNLFDLFLSFDFIKDNLKKNDKKLYNIYKIKSIKNKIELF